MAESLNIEEYRKRRKRKKFIKKAVAFIVLLGVVLVTLFIWQTVANKASDTGKNFPISLSGSTVVSSKIQDNNLAVLTDKNLIFYNMNGKELRSIGYSYKSPVISESAGNILFYDADGANFSVENFSKTVLTKSLSDKIYLGAVASNGNTAIVTADSRYICDLIIYNKKGDEIYKWQSAQDLIMSIEFTGGGTGCVIATTGISNSLTSTVVYELNFSNKNEIFHSSIDDSTPLGIGKIGGFYHVVTDRSIEILDQNGSVFKEVDVNQSIRQCAFAGGKYTVLLLGQGANSQSVIQVYDQNGNKVGESLSNNRIKKISSDGARILSLDDNNINVYTMELKQTKSYTNQKNAVDIICKGSVGFEIGSSFIDKISIT